MHIVAVVWLISCVQIFCNPMDCSPPSSSVHQDFPGKKMAVGCHFLLQGNLPDPGPEPLAPSESLTLQAGRLFTAETPGVCVCIYFSQISFIIFIYLIKVLGYLRQISSLFPSLHPQMSYDKTLLYIAAVEKYFEFE